jgi:hypothetical protein
MKPQWLLYLAMVGLVGCASMTKEQCLEAGSTSWENIGWVDGRDGWDPEQRLAMHREACQEVRILPDRNTYMRGWHNGVFEYCTPDRGYEVGLGGSSGNSRVCPGDSGYLFDENVELGLQIYNLRSEIARLESEISSYEQRLTDKKLDYETKRDLHAMIRNRDTEQSHLRMLLNEALARPIIRN